MENEKIIYNTCNKNAAIGLCRGVFVAAQSRVHKTVC